MTARTRSGTTLVELLVLLFVVGLLAALTVPATLRAREAAAVRSARDATANVIARARMQALARGSARVWVDLRAAVVRMESPIGSTTGEPLRLSGSAVTVVVDRATSPSVAIDFDGLGMGRLANRTLRFQRGSAEARLTLSSYGRPRRW
jgi:type II secretory pathway pseudopilin PulG